MPIKIIFVYYINVCTTHNQKQKDVYMTNYTVKYFIVQLLTEWQIKAL